ncbi:Bro-N domain-containing protein [Salmonella enterica]|nr:Bro-N domain-containing protein [Salmonella enterica]EIK0388773.1 Bro-N domain-containing protein [Salmonella enterica]
MNVKHELIFKEQAVGLFNNRDGKIWFTAETLADLLGYADARKVLNIYNRRKDEFTDSMTMVSKVRTNGINNSLREVDVRLFSLRGAHLIGMFARTKIAKELRHWLLDLADQESGVDIGTLELEDIRSLPGEQIHHRIAEFNQKSLAFRGQPGSKNMTQRRRDLKKIREATVLAIELTQLQICDMGDFPEGEEMEA